MLDEYDRLMNEKKNGKIFDFDSITYDELRKLWYNESFCDSIIANLYDVKKSQVTKNRKEMGIHMFDGCWESILEKLSKNFA